MELIETLVSNLGINTEQAEGGMGVLLNSAKDKLSAGDFSQLTSQLPDWEKYVSAAPAEESGGGGMLGAIGGIASSMGMGDKVGGLASLLGGFEKLGLDMATLQKFLPIVTQFFESKGGGSVASLLQSFTK